MASYMEPTNWEIDLAVHNVNAAKTEAGAAKAAAAVYRIGLDTPDAVLSAFEEKVAMLRNPNWRGRNPPQLPRTFRPMPLIVRAYKELQALAQKEAAAAAAAAAAAPTARPAPTVRVGPPPARRGPPPARRGPPSSRRGPPPTRGVPSRPRPLNTGNCCKTFFQNETKQ